MDAVHFGELNFEKVNSNFNNGKFVNDLFSPSSTWNIYKMSRTANFSLTNFLKYGKKIKTKKIHIIVTFNHQNNINAL